MHWADVLDGSTVAFMEKAEIFHKLHEDRTTFLMPNAWDAGTAIILAEAGFAAIGTTSAGIAFSLGRADGAVPTGATAVSRTQMFDRMREIVEAVDIPVSGDLEGGYGERPEAVAETIQLALDTGLAGGSIEDHAGATFYDDELAVERIAAARQVIDASGTHFVLTARADGLLMNPGGLAAIIERLNRFREAGADCLYAPGVNDRETISTLVREVNGPLNVVLGLTGAALSVADLRATGVTRISLGGSIARAALGFVRRAAQELVEHGTIDFADLQISQGDLNNLFVRRELG
jgi:2-methylisocitrate lyase-like PEP mutase family enzyme